VNAKQYSPLVWVKTSYNPKTFRTETNRIIFEHLHLQKNATHFCPSWFHTDLTEFPWSWRSPPHGLSGIRRGKPAPGGSNHGPEACLRIVNDQTEKNDAKVSSKDILMDDG